MSTDIELIRNALIDTSLSVDEVWKLFTEKPSRIKQVDSKGDLPIHIECAYRGRYDLISKMIEMYPESLKTRGALKQLPLHRAVFRKMSEEVIFMLIDKCPSAAKQREALGCLPILAECIGLCRPAVLSKLIEVFPDSLNMSGAPGSYDSPPLETAIRNKLCSVEAACLLISKNPKSLKRKDVQGRYAIHLESECHCRWPVIKLCLDLFPKCGRIADEDGFTPLHNACRNEGDSRETALNLIERYPDILRLENSLTGSRPIQIECSTQRRLDVIKKCVEHYPESLAIAGNGMFVPFQCLFYTCFNNNDFEEKKEVFAYIISQYPAAFRLPNNNIYENQMKTFKMNRFLLNLVPSCLPSKFIPSYRDCNWQPRAAMIKALLQLRNDMISSHEESKEDHSCIHDAKSSGPLARSAALCHRLFESFDNHDMNRYSLGSGMDSGSVLARNIVSYL